MELGHVYNLGTFVVSRWFVFLDLGPQLELRAGYRHVDCMGAEVPSQQTTREDSSEVLLDPYLGSREREGSLIFNQPPFPSST